ncbi:unnamed protein product [Rotaria sp. Silwood2]|nr:unnamed protein product [Rotaria sp. Silwood2]CAF4116387.1 unnamed protein product [Rotaria sp. Silwood2]CAF4390466.1 unnamed protein product [Rotaria sp. Silwood2]
MENLEHEGKRNNARKRRISLSALEELQSLVDKVNILKYSRENINDEMSNRSVNDNQQNDDVIDNCDQEEFPITKESLSNMYQDFVLRPMCSERHVISLLYYISLKLVDNTIILDENIVRPDQIQKEIDKEYQCLKERLNVEELSASEIQESIERFSINIKNENWESSIISLRNIFKEINPLDTYKLFRLINKVENTAELIKNKDIIFFSEVLDQNLDLKYIKTAPFAKSVTQYITSVSFKPEDVGIYSSNSIILCDSPGFYDTRGPEVDIANGIGIVKAIKGCKSVKPVVLVSYKSSGNRYEGLKNLTHLLAGLIPGIKDYIQAFSYLFTKYPENERDTIHASLKDIYIVH